MKNRFLRYLAYILVGFAAAFGFKPGNTGKPSDRVNAADGLKPGDEPADAE